MPLFTFVQGYWWVNHVALLVHDHGPDSSIHQFEDSEGPGEVPVPVQDDGERDNLEEVNHPSPSIDVASRVAEVLHIKYWAITSRIDCSYSNKQLWIQKLFNAWNLSLYIS